MEPPSPHQTDQEHDAAEAQLSSHGTPYTEDSVGAGEKQNSENADAPHAAEVENEWALAVACAAEGSDHNDADGK